MNTKDWAFIYAALEEVAVALYTKGYNDCKQSTPRALDKQIKLTKSDKMRLQTLYNQQGK